MRRILVGGLAIIGGLAILVVAVGLSIGVVYWISKGRVPAKTILEVDFERGLTEYVPDDPVAQVMLAKAPIVRNVVDALKRASKDDRVVALVARVGVAKMGLAQIQEVRDAALAFRSTGKPAIAYAETFGEAGPGNGAYYFATAFDAIYLQPSGDVNLTGLISEQPFIRGTLEKLGITPHMDHRREYKNIMNLFTERKYTEPHREATQKVMDSHFGQIVQGIAAARGLSAEKLRAVIDRGPFLGQEAMEAKLVDGLAYRDEVYAKVKEKAGTGAKFLYLSTYLERAGRPYTKGQTIALVYGVGGVQRGKSEYNPVFGSLAMGSDSVTAAFREAIEEKNVKAIVFRVDSPGGSYVASDAMWREVVRAKQAGKPVIVSMGNVAGSGGYFVSMAADKIVAQPATITGSIGVLGGKMLTAGLWEKLGVAWDEVHTNSNATMWTGTHDYTPEDWTRFQDGLDRVYDDFTSKVAQGRHLPKEKVLEVAKGRIWSGEDAKALGLVDELGGFPVALRLAKAAAGIPEDADIHMKVFPAEKTSVRRVLEKLLDRGAESSEGQAATVALTRALQAVQPLAHLAREIGFGRGSGALAMPPLEPPW
jgi:protease IV